MQKNTTCIAIGIAATLLIPGLLTLLAIWHWKPGAILLAGVLLVGASVIGYRLVSTKRLAHLSYRFAVAVAIVAVLILVWINGAVGGILGDDPANMMYFGVLLVGLAGSMMARLEPAGMSWTLLATAFALVLVPAIAWMLGTPAFFNGVPAVFALHVALSLPFVTSAWLFNRAAHGSSTPVVRVA